MMARTPKVNLEDPRGRRAGVLTRTPAPSRDRFGRFTEWVARAMGTPTFLLILSLFCVGWIMWNTLAPEAWRFDSQTYGFTVLTLVLSLQASYAAPLILLAQNRQDDRDRVQIEQDRQRAERNMADTEYLAREVVALRMALSDVSDQVLTRDVLRQELRALLEDLTPAEPETERETALPAGETAFGRPEATGAAGAPAAPATPGAPAR